jgi:hypothetical protein
LCNNRAETAAPPRDASDASLPRRGAVAPLLDGMTDAKGAKA